MSPADFDEIATKLARFDVATNMGPWTERVLALVAEHPEVRAAALAQASGLAQEWLNLNVCKLKYLGLTESLPRGYRLSPCGRVVLKNLRQSRTKQT